MNGNCSISEFTSLGEFCQHHGVSPISKILVATNGLSAVKGIRSIAEWCVDTFKDKPISFIVLTTKEEIKCNNEYVRLGDNCVIVDTITVESVVKSAVRKNVDAVFVGWGRVSENPQLSRRLQERNIKFIGPSFEAMSLLGDKLSSTKLAHSLGIPTLPWSEDKHEFSKVGFPLVVKATAGGGGKGIRVAHDESEFTEAFDQVSLECPGSPIMLMRLAKAARHVEIQLVGDSHGNVLSLYGRDCSLQFRHQKVVEEAPASVPPSTLRKMEEAGISLFKAAGYVGVGTMELLYRQETDEFYFLEVNPRLQVEHPCTEAITGLNIPSLQLQVAMGLPLPCIPQIRRFCPHIADLSSRIPPLKHVISARVRAGNFDNPSSTGDLFKHSFYGWHDVWAYFGLSSPALLHPSADSQIGHVFASGDCRETARKRLVSALGDMLVLSQFNTFTESIIQVLSSPEFIGNVHDTKFFESRPFVQNASLLLPALCGAVLLADKVLNLEKYTCSLQRGQVLPSEDLRNTFTTTLISQSHKFVIQVARIGRFRFAVVMGSEMISLDVHRLPDGALLIMLADSTHIAYIEEINDSYQVTVDRRTTRFSPHNDTTTLRSPSSGRLLSYLVPDGSFVGSGQPYAQIEALKMVIQLRISHNGWITHTCIPNSPILAGTILARFTPQDDKLTCTFSEWDQGFMGIRGRTDDGDLLEKYGDACSAIRSLFDGYTVPQPFFQSWAQSLLDSFMDCALDPHLPLEEIKCNVMSVKSLLPPQVFESIMYLLELYNENATSLVVKFPSKKIKDIIDNYLSEGSGSREVVEGMYSILEKYKKGIGEHFKATVTGFMDRYYDTEVHFQHFQYDTCVTNLMELHQNKADLVAAQVFSHYNVDKKNEMMLMLINFAFSHSAGIFRDIQPTLTKLTTLTNPANSPVALRARQVLLAASLPPLQLRVNQVELFLLSAVTKYEDEFCKTQLDCLISSEASITDVLGGFFFHRDPKICRAAMEVYLRRSYVSFNIVKLTHSALSSTQRIISFFCQQDQRELKENSNTCGHMVSYNSTVEFNREFEQLIKFAKDNSKFPKFDGERFYTSLPCSSTVIVALNCGDAPELREICQKNKELMHAASIERITFIFIVNNQEPLYTTFVSSLDFAEETLLRNLDPALANQLEMDRLSNYDVEAISQQPYRMYIFLGRQKDSPNNCRFFLRVIVGYHGLITMGASAEYLQREGENALHEAVSMIEHGFSHPMAQKTELNHIFFIFVPTFTINNINTFKRVIQKMIYKQISRLKALRILVGEVRVKVGLNGQPPSPIRVFVSNITGFMLELTMYREELDDEGKVVLRAFDSGQHDGLPVNHPHMFTSNKLRCLAHRLEALYIDDIPLLFQTTLFRLWRAHLALHPEGTRPNQFMWCEEIGGRRVGAVAWRMVLCTPEYPAGREIILLSNDMTVKQGSFGVEEDDFFHSVIQTACNRGVPLVYLSMNSGARIGLAEEIKGVLRIEWECPDNPEKGFKYMYLTEQDYDLLKDFVVATPRQTENGDTHYVVTDIIGQQKGLGVDNLSGSARIASAMSRAYNKIMTLSLVMCRTVGIGAYLVRLSRRVIQVENSSILLTGAAALNKVLGKDVYTSNNQLGGVHIMHKNGIARDVVSNANQGILRVLELLSFTPRVIGDPLPTFPVPLGGPISHSANIRETLSAFFDRHTFIESMGDYAQTMICGRARIGGIPVGVIAANTETVQLRIPADPANPNSEARVIQQAPFILLPDSSFKMAEAISDFNREQLPLMIFANWRGFSGGMMDMYDQVLKFGSYIVDELSVYPQPVFVYIGRQCELRGGAWVVLDSAINPARMEMYADSQARGGILEPEAIVKIKFKTSEIYRWVAASNVTPTDQHLPHYTRAANYFASLHDTPRRMEHLGVIRKIVDFEDSRRFFYWRLRRRLNSDYLQRKYRIDLKGQEALFLREGNSAESFEDDCLVAAWLAAKVKEGIDSGDSGESGDLIGKFEQICSDDTSLRLFLDSLSPEALSKIRDFV